MSTFTAGALQRARGMQSRSYGSKAVPSHAPGRTAAAARVRGSICVSSATSAQRLRLVTALSQIARRDRAPEYHQAGLQAGAELSCAAWPRAVRAASPAHPCAYGMDTAFLSLGTRSCSCIARAQEADAAVARPEPVVVRLSHAPLAGVAWAASIVSPDSAARVSTQN